MEIHQFVPIGSYNKGTYLTKYSDKDFLIILNEKDFYQGIHYIANEIVKDYHVIGIDLPSIQVKYKNGKSDLTPCLYNGTINTQYGKLDSFLIYDIQGYKKTCPLLFQKYLEEMNNHYDKKLIPFIIIMKQWKYENDISLSSFQLELLAIEYFSQTSFRTPDNFISILNQLCNTNFSELNRHNDLINYI